jgi:hypothetical protein
MPYVPGSGAQNAGYAVTYGDLGETNRMNLVRMLDQQNQERQDKIEAQQRADAAHKFALQKYYGKEFDPSNFDTGTDLNKSINDALIQGKKNLAEILNDPNSSDQDIDNAAQQALTPAMKLYQIGTAVKRNVDATTDAFKNDKGLDVGSLKTQAYINALYTKDPKTGKLRLKNDQELSQIDPEHNYAADILQNHPELVAKGDVDYNGLLKNFPVANQKLDGSWYSSPGVKHKSNFDASWYDGVQKLVKDDKGVYGIQTANEPIETTDANGNKIKINQIPESVINTMQSTPGAKAKLDVATMQYLAQHSPNVSVEPGTPAFEMAKRAMVYEMFDKNAPKRISKGQDINKSGSLIRMELGYPMPGSSNGSKSGEDLKQETQASFNDITDVPFVGDNGVVGTISNGKFQPRKGILGAFTPKYDGSEVEGSIPLDKLPVSVFNAVTAGNSKNDITGEKDNVGDPIGKVKVKITDGQITAIKTDHGWFDVNSRQNANIKVENTTRSIKDKEKYKLPDTKKPKSDPLGIL